MTSPELQTNSEVRVLGRALDQVGDVLDHVHEDQLATPTPCEDWDVATLVDHLVGSPPRFLTTMRGGEADWTTPPPHVTEGWAGAFRSEADDLIHAWHELDARHEQPPAPAGMQIAEYAVHGWDLATAIGFPVDQLDPEVAEVALAFLRSALRPELRGDAFGPERPAPPGAGPYESLAAFAGRAV